MGPQEALHGFQHRLQLLLLPDLGLCHLSHIQLAARQFFCNEKDKSKTQGVRKRWRVSGPPGAPAARGPLPHPARGEQIITEQWGAVRMGSHGAPSFLVLCVPWKSTPERKGGVEVEGRPGGVPLGNILGT